MTPEANSALRAKVESSGVFKRSGDFSLKATGDKVTAPEVLQVYWTFLDEIDKIIEPRDGTSAGDDATSLRHPETSATNA